MVHLHTVIWLIFAFVIIAVRLASTKEGFQSKTTRIILCRFALICVTLAIAIIDAKDSLSVFFDIFYKLRIKGYHYAVASDRYFGIGITRLEYGDAYSVILNVISVLLLILSMLRAPLRKTKGHITSSRPDQK